MATTITLNASPTWAGIKDDYLLRYEGHLIGRIRLAESEWQWEITIPMEMPNWAQGSSKDVDGCRKAFADAWGRFLRETSPARLERAWELERGAAARHERLQAAGKQAT
jgi:hypothetical protein